MAVKKAKAAARKVKDKWKAKEWYKLYAPRMFNQVELGETPSSDPATIMGRNTEVTVHELTGDFSKMHIKIRFIVNDVRGLDAHTIFAGHDLTSDYVRRLTRRKRTKTDHVVDVRTKDGFLVRVKPMSITEQRIQAAQETAIRNIMTNTLNEQAANMTVSELVKAIITGDLSKDLSIAAKAIIPIKRIEVRKSEVLEFGTAAADEPSIQERFGQEAAAQAAAEPSEAPAEEAPAEEGESEEAEEEVAEESEE
ncbi:MAG: 30S ribosomal protein S3ae [Methanomassiliicoccus sp.]|nr:30S ribosomal protein S3ae [Methanomassiliicoccus sp.]